MGQLTNLYVSQSYQGLLKMTDSTNGLTNTLQTVQTGDGDNSPLQMSLTAVNISGSFTVNGLPVAADTGSLVTTSSFNAYTSSVNTQLAGLNIETGSLQNQINGLATTSSLTSLSSSIAVTDLNQNNVIAGLATTGSLSGFTTTTTFNNYTSSNDSKVNTLIAGTGSYATTSSLTALSQSIASTDLSQDNRLTALEGITGSINRNGLITTGSAGGSQSITGSLNVQGTISATSASFTYINTIYETASVIYSSGSNQFGDASNDTQTLWGTVVIPSGPVSVTGSVTATNFTGSLQGTASFATTTISSSFAQNAVSASFASFATNAGNLGGVAASSYARRNTTNTFTADQTIDSGSSLIVNEIISNAGDRLLILSDGTVSGPGARIIIGDTPSGGDPNVISDTTVSITGSLGVSGGITSPNFTGLASNSTLFSGRGIAQFALTGSNSFNGNQNVTGNVTASLGFFGNLQGTASFATNALSASWAPDTTNTGSLMTTGSVAGNVLTFTKGDGSQFNLTVATGSGGGTIDTGSFATTGSNIFRGNQTLTGSFNQTGSMNVIGNPSNPSATIARFGDPSYGVVDISGNGALIATNNIGVTNIQNWNTVGSSNITVNNTLGDVYIQGKNATGSVIIGSNQSSKTIITGSLLSPSITGSLEGTASYATQALSASYAPSTPIDTSYFATTGSNVFKGFQQILNDLEINSSNPVGTFVNMVSTGTTSFLMDSPLTQFQSNGQMVFTNTLSSTGSSNISFLTQNGGNINFNTSNSGSINVTGSLILSGSAGPELNVKGDVLITGSVIMSGSAGVELDVKGDQTNTGSVNISGSVNITGSINNRGDVLITNRLMTNTFNNVSSSMDGNILFGWDGTVPQNLATASLVISGSNNIVSAGRPQGQPGYYGYISGSNNVMLGGYTNLSTGSLLRPVIQNNIVNSGGVLLNFTTSSVAGGQPSFSSNFINSQFTINLPNSGSATVGGNIINGQVQLIQTGSAIANLRGTFSSNNINSSFIIQNFASSSFTANNNNTVGASHGIYNYFVNDFGTAGITTSRNFFSGQLNSIYISGSSSSNVTRAIGDSFIGGLSSEISASLSGSNNANGSAIFMYGRNLVANATSATNAGGNAFLGRFNDTGSLANTNDIVLAVGTGFAAANRRTGLYVTTGSLVGVSGSLDVKGNTTITGSLTASSSLNHNIIGTQILITGNTIMSGSSPLYVSGTIQTQRVHWDGNPFNTNPSSTLGAIRMAGDNQTFQYTNYDKAQITTQSFIDQIVNTGSLSTRTRFGATYAGTTTQIETVNDNGSRIINLNSDATTITGSLAVTGDVKFASGSNTTMGTFVLNGGNPGTATVSNTLVTANSLIFLTKQTNTNSGNGTVSVTSKGSGTFSVTSDHNGDADTVAYLIINPT